MMKKVIQAMSGVVIAIIGTLALCGCGTDPMNAKLTEANYNSIVVNTTTYTQVEDLFGDPTGTSTLTDGAGSLTWANADETKTVTLTFAANVVTAKAQTGLI